MRRGHSYEYDGKIWHDGLGESSEDEDGFDRPWQQDLDLGSSKYAAATDKLAETRLSLQEAQAALHKQPLDEEKQELVSELKRREFHFKRRVHHFRDYACRECYAAKYADELKATELGGVGCCKCQQRFCPTCFAKAARTPFPDCPGDGTAYCIECWEWMRDKPMRRERAKAAFEKGVADLKAAEAVLSKAQKRVHKLRVFSCEGCYYARRRENRSSDSERDDSDDERAYGSSWTCAHCSDVYCEHCSREYVCHRCFDDGVCKRCCEVYYGHEL
jgi:hypothetical protein